MSSSFPTTLALANRTAAALTWGHPGGEHDGFRKARVYVLLDLVTDEERQQGVVEEHHEGAAYQEVLISQGGESIR